MDEPSPAGAFAPPLYTLGLLVGAGFVAGAVAARFGVPRVAAYVVAGALFSEDLLGGVLDLSTSPWSEPMTSAALGFVAFLIGAELHIKRFHTLGKSVLGAAVGQSLGALVVVTAGLVLYARAAGVAFGWRSAMVVGAIAVATAPAATIAVLEETQSKGPMSSILLGLVAVDDAIGIVLFSLATGLATAGNLAANLGRAVFEIAGSLLLGGALGALLGVFGRRIEREDLRLPPIVGFVLVTAGLAHAYGMSPLLACMVLGLVSKVLFERSRDEWVAPLGHVNEVIYLVLFTLAGQHLDVDVFTTSFGFIAVYVVARAVGKYAGVSLGASAAHAPECARRYLGLALLPQAGVSIGLALVATANPALERSSALVLNTILGSTILFELVGPVLTKLALRRAAEAHA